MRPSMFGLATMLAIATPAIADSPLPPADYANVQLRDPDQEARAKDLMGTLRCLVCQGQSIADSDAEMAGDMRSLVRKRILAGESPDAIRESLVSSYGEYVSYDPPFNWLTAPLWLMPLVLAGIGTWLARGSFRRRRG
ncbi:cytochrome c-type biogenesis protein [Sphingomonas aliaeris]|nr:cytochrome c-type biogenesis protein [Sphingomonas aliaeris]